MVDGSADRPAERARPRPVGEPTPSRSSRPTRQGRRSRRGGALARVGAVGAVGSVDAQQANEIATRAGHAVVAAARVGRLLGRSGWRIARQLPGGAVLGAVESQTQHLRHRAAEELVKMLELPQQLVGSANPEEQRAVMLVQNAPDDAEPLRTAMGELLERAGDTDRARSRDYLFGTIVSQLVPDEARILAALAAGDRFALVEVTTKRRGRANARTVLSNASTVGVAAGVASPASAPTYVGRLRGFGLVEVTPADGAELAEQFDALEQSEAVLQARAEVDRGAHGSSRAVRKVLGMSEFGRQFWAACAPTGALPDSPPR